MELMSYEELKKKIEEHKDIPKREMLRRFLRGKDRFDSSFVPENKLEEFNKEVEHAKERMVIVSEIMKMLEPHCDRCGKCCEVTYVSLDQRDMRRISRFLKMNVYDFAEKYLKKDAHFPYLDCHCPFLIKENGKENGKAKCKIYYVRPEACKLFPFGDNTMTVAYCELGKYIDNLTDVLGFTVSEDRALAEKDIGNIDDKNKKLDLAIGEMKDTGSGTVMIIDNKHLKIIMETVKIRMKKKQIR